METYNVLGKFALNSPFVVVIRMLIDYNMVDFLKYDTNMFTLLSACFVWYAVYIITFILGKMIVECAS